MSPPFKKELKENGLVLATGNSHKVRELEAMLLALSITVESVCGILENFDVEETGADFHENAALKAQSCFAETGRVSLADDSGLAVDALNGRPGVHSARYGGQGLTDRERCLLLLDELKDVPLEQRTARFVCVLALCTGKRASDMYFFEGKAEGRILYGLLGENGFGYDEVFFDPVRDIGFAQMEPKEKDSCSHRGQAVRQFIQFLL